ncbi:MAG: ABC transporter ATP-binding protein, partial [Candidatus Sumerlaeaceae bacterium]
LSCVVRGRQLLADVTLAVSSGELLAVLGPNGAGKTTLLRVLALALEPSSGCYELLGNDVSRLDARTRAALKCRVGYVAQRSLYNPMIPLTAFDVLATGLLGGRGLWGRLSRVQRQHLHAVAERFQITELLARPYRVLSGGEQQKVQIARAWGQEPDLLLLDEPTSGLDLTWQRRVVDLLESLQRESRVSIIMTTHHPHHLPASCKRVALLSSGQVVYDGPPEAPEFAEWRRNLFGSESGATIESPEARWGTAWF